MDLFFVFVQFINSVPKVIDSVLAPFSYEKDAGVRFYNLVDVPVFNLENDETSFFAI